MKKKAYLTIDDSPSPSFLRKVAYLKQKNIPALFFCIGNLLEKDPKPIIEAIQMGFVIANHSYSHPHFSAINLAQAKEEILKTDTIIEDLYRKANRPRNQKWFRFPYGDKGDGLYGQVFKRTGIKSWFTRPNSQRKAFIQNVLLEAGYTQPSFDTIPYQYMHSNGLFKEVDWHWTFDIMEWATFENKPTQKLKNLAALIRRMELDAPEDARGKIGAEKRWMKTSYPEIVLLHDHAQTDDLFNPIIDYLNQLPLEFVGFDDL